MISIIISGKDRTGKSIIGEHLRNQNICVIELGEIVRREYFQKGFKGTVSHFYDKNRNIYIDNILINEIKKEFKKSSKDKNSIVIIGVRSIDLINKIKTTIKENIVIFIESDFNIRFKRYLLKINSRDREPLLDKNLFFEQDLLQEKWGILKIKEESNFVITNNGSITTLINKINKILDI